MDKRVVIGLGTGRCGTLSLSRLINAQRTARVSHEGSFNDEPEKSWLHLPWTVSKKRFDAVVECIISHRAPIVGDVAFYYLPYVEMLIKKFSDIRFVCLKRTKEEVVRSFIAKTARKNHWSAESHREQYFRRNHWDLCFPKYALPKKQAIERYWEEYYLAAKSIRKQYPDKFRIWWIGSALNTEAGQVDMLSFIGIKRREMILDVGTRKNQLVAKKKGRKRKATPK